MIYHTVPLVLKIGQIPLSAVDNQQYYMVNLVSTTNFNKIDSMIFIDET